MEKEHILIGLNKVSQTKQNQQQEDEVKQIFNDIDLIIKKAYQSIPNVSSELFYKVELEKATKINMVLAFMGFLMILAVIMFII